MSDRCRMAGMSLSQIVIRADRSSKKAARLEFVLPKTNAGGIALSALMNVLQARVDAEHALKPSERQLKIVSEPQPLTDDYDMLTAYVDNRLLAELDAHAETNIDYYQQEGHTAA